MDVLRGLRQALVLIVCLAALALVISGIWMAVAGGALRVKVGIILLVTAALLSLTGNAVFTRTGTAEIDAIQGTAAQGTAADRDQPTGGVLTGVGIFVFVALPLFVAGGVLYGTG
jgi:hypothetical protein